MRAIKPLVFLFALTPVFAGAQDGLPISQLEDATGLESASDGNMEGVPGLAAAASPLVPAATQTAASAAAAPRPKLFSGAGFAIVGGIGSNALLGFSVSGGGALFGLGLEFRYDSQGIENGQERLTDRLSTRLLLSFAFMVYNKSKLAFGPEFGLLSSLTPGPSFTTYSQLRPGVAFWYAPFDVPLYFGTALLLPITFQVGAEPVVATEYPGLRLRWGF